MPFEQQEMPEGALGGACAELFNALEIPCKTGLLHTCRALKRPFRLERRESKVASPHLEGVILGGWHHVRVPSFPGSRSFMPASSCCPQLLLPAASVQANWLVFCHGRGDGVTGSPSRKMSGEPIPKTSKQSICCLRTAFDLAQMQRYLWSVKI